MAFEITNNLFAANPRRRPLWETLQVTLPISAIQDIIASRQTTVTLFGTEYKMRKGGGLNSLGQPEAVMLISKQTNISEHTREDVDGFYRRITVLSGRRATEKLYTLANETLVEIEIPT